MKTFFNIGILGPSLLCNLIVRLSTTTSEKRHFAISPLVGSEQFYLQVKYFRPAFGYPTEETLQMKDDICANVIGSSLFNMQHFQEPMNLHEEGIRAELKQKYPDSYKDHYYENKNFCSKGIHIVNPYKLRDIIVGEDRVQEYVFSCFARNCTKTMDIIQYFISPEYDINESTKSSENITGRFVFFYNEKKEIVVIALAEEPAQILEYAPDGVEDFFQNGMQENTLWKKDDAICGLKIFQKVRLCTIILNGNGYAGKVSFMPHKDNIEPQCELRKICFQHTNNFNPARDLAPPVDEFMIGCKAIQANNVPITYYVSRGFKANTFFICKQLTLLETILENVSDKVSVVPATYL